MSSALRSTVSVLNHAVLPEHRNEARDIDTIAIIMSINSRKSWPKTQAFGDTYNIMVRPRSAPPYMARGIRHLIRSYLAQKDVDAAISMGPDPLYSSGKPNVSDLDRGKHA